MLIIKGQSGEDMVYYDKPGEFASAHENYRSGNWAALTCLQIAEFRREEEDPYGIRWDAEHAGMLLGVTKEYVEDVLIVYRPCGETMEQSWAWLRGVVGKKPITLSGLWIAIYFFNNTTKV